MFTSKDFLDKYPAGHPDQFFGPVTYSQHEDDLMVANLFKMLKIPKPSYLDLGAHHPYIISYTALLYERGSRGVNIEANPNLIADFLKYRPEDKTVNVAVGPVQGTFPFYMYSSDSGRNTLDPEEVKRFQAVRPDLAVVRKQIEVKVLTLPEIISEFCGGTYPDFISCDVEGFDLQIMAMLPDEDRGIELPKLICVEIRPDSIRDMDLIMKEKGFMPYCRMISNQFYVRTDLFMLAMGHPY